VGQLSTTRGEYSGSSKTTEGANVNLCKIVVALSLSSLAAIAFADDAHHPDEKAQPAPPQAAPKAPRDAMEMSSMQANMKRMQEQMAQIRASSDPKERERLMDEHMKTMQESMSKMHSMMSGGKAMDSRQRLELLERHMDMMQIMMQQMMEHDAAGHPAPK
jgi:hypothetical protein